MACAAIALEALGETADALGLELHREPPDFYETATERDFAFIERHRASAEALRYYRDLTVEPALARPVADAERDDVEPAQREWLARARRLWHGGKVAEAARRLRIAAGAAG